jgi:hypothetical protein
MKRLLLSLAAVALLTGCPWDPPPAPAPTCLDESSMHHADQHDVDVIVVGSRGHGSVASALFGSVSMQILQRSTQPVIVVRAGRPPAKARR